VVTPRDQDPPIDTRVADDDGHVAGTSLDDVPLWLEDLSVSAASPGLGWTWVSRQCPWHRDRADSEQSLERVGVCREEVSGFPVFGS
jgi:hypothetical protein